MKKLLTATIFGIILSFPGFGVGQETSCPQLVFTSRDMTNPDMSFCQKDSSPAHVKAFCKQLAQLQAYANANPHADSKACSSVLSLVGNLDLTADIGQKLNTATPSFIAAIGADLATRTAISNVLRDLGQKRPDQQLGSAAATSGTTTLVSKAGSAELLALAVDAGALTKSVNGTATTLSTNADQLFRLITGNDPDCTITCSRRNPFENALNYTNVTATFDLAQPSSTITATTGQASGATPVLISSAAIPTGVGKLSSIAVRYQVMNRFDPRGEKFKTAWKKEVPSLASKLAIIGDDSEAVFAVLKTHAPWSGGGAEASSAERDLLAKAIAAREVLAAAALKDAKGDELVKAFDDYWNLVVTEETKRDVKLASAVSKAIQDRAVYREAWLKALDDAVGNLLTFEYSFNRPVSQPETDDFKVIYAYNFKKTGMVTFNGALSLYNGAIPAGANYGRVHYGQVSAEYDRTTSGKTGSLQTQLSLAGYWQYQPQPSILNIPAGTVAPGTNIPLPNGTQEFVGTAGSLWVTQAKLTIKGAGGINIPIGVSWSNKTDLLQGSKVGAQVGISYNFASFAGLFSSAQ